MDMWRVNKILIILLFILLGCNHHQKKEDLICSVRGQMGGYILFDNFEKIDNVVFETLNASSISKKYLGDKLKKHENKILRLKINQKTSKIIENDCYVTINDSLKYKITDVEFIKVERFGMWGSVGFSCNLKHYKINDSLVDDQQTILISNDIVNDLK